MIHVTYWVLQIFSGLVAIQLILLTLLITLSMMALFRSDSSRNDSTEQSLRVVRTMKTLNFGSIIFKEATECAICLSKFQNNHKIVQLKCSKYHIFHSECLEKMVIARNNKCPLCRQQLQIQDPPIL